MTLLFKLVCQGFLVRETLIFWPPVRSWGRKAFEGHRAAGGHAGARSAVHFPP